MSLEKRGIESHSENEGHTKPFVPEDVHPEVLDVLEDREVKNYLNKVDEVYMWHDDFLANRFMDSGNKFEDEFPVILMHGFNTVRRKVLDEVLRNEEVEAGSRRAVSLAKKSEELQKSIAEFSRSHGDLVEILRDPADPYDHRRAKHEIVQDVYRMLIDMERLMEEVYGEPKKPLAYEIMTAGTAVRANELVSEDIDPIEYWFESQEDEKRSKAGSASWEVESRSFEREVGSDYKEEVFFSIEDKFSPDEIESIGQNLDNRFVSWKESGADNLGPIAKILAMKEVYGVDLRNQEQIERWKPAVKEYLAEEIAREMKNGITPKAADKALMFFTIFPNEDLSSNEELRIYFDRLEDEILQGSSKISTFGIAAELGFLKLYDRDAAEKFRSINMDMIVGAVRRFKAKLNDIRNNGDRDSRELMADIGYYLEEMTD